MSISGSPAREPLHALRGHERWVFSIAFSLDRQWLVSGGDDQSLRLTILQQRRCPVELFKESKGPISELLV